MNLWGGSRRKNGFYRKMKQGMVILASIAFILSIVSSVNIVLAEDTTIDAFWGIMIREDFEADAKTVTYHLTNIEAEGAPNTVLKGSDFTATLTSVNGYLLPETVTVTMSGEVVEAEYASETGIIKVTNVTGAIEVTAEGVVNEDLYGTLRLRQYQMLRFFTELLG